MIIKRLLFGNYLLSLPVLAWCAAQLAKTIIYLIMNRKFNVERLFGAGGMPSSHSATVCALFMGAARAYGLQSPYFAITFVLAAIVMYDAMGVRLETGKQAKVLNRILEDFRADNTEADEFDKLKELVGHTPLQVVSGALLGIVIALLVPVF